MQGVVGGGEYYNKGLMAEWSKRGTVNTFYRGSNPLKAYFIKIK